MHIGDDERTFEFEPISTPEITDDPAPTEATPMTEPEPVKEPQPA